MKEKAGNSQYFYAFVFLLRKSFIHLPMYKKGNVKENEKEDER
jgi:hypothetical protein